MVQWFFFNEISCPLKGFCPEIFNFLLVEVFCPDELFDFLPEKASARDISFSFLPEKRLLPEMLFLSCPLKRLLHGNIIWFPARGKTFARIYFYLLPVGRLIPGDIIFMFCPLKGFCPEGLFSFLPLEWLLPVSLSLSADQIPSAQVGRGCRSPWRRRALPKFLVCGRCTEAALVVVRYLISRSFKFRRILSSSSLCCLEYSPIDTCIQTGLFPTLFLALTYSCMIGYLLLFLWQKEGKKVSIVETFLAAPTNKRKKKLRFPQSGCSLQRRTHKETPKRITQR
jgi:hypothetical protein